MGKGFHAEGRERPSLQGALFGLKAPLGPEDVTLVTYLTGVGAEFYLTTVDGQHSFIYLGGVLTKVVNWEAEMTGLFRDPAKLGHFGDNTAPWSKKEAERAAEALVRAKGMNIQQMSGKPKPVVQPETF